MKKDVIITKENNSLVIQWGKTKYSFPLNTIILIGNDMSDLVNVRLKSSRMNVLSFMYYQVANIEATSATEMCEQISVLSNK